MTTVLVVEDDEALGSQIVEHLTKAGFGVEWIKDGDVAVRVDLTGFDLVVLDLMLPGTYGLDVLKRYRKRSDLPVLILSARDETRDKVRGLELGADDYMTKPFWPDELVARVTARLRRPLLRRGENVAVGPLALDLGSREFQLRGKVVELTKVEFEILAFLAERVDSAVSRAALVDGALDPDRQGTERTLDVHISRLRKKLGAEAGMIETVWGVGYRLRSSTTVDDGSA